MLGSMDYRVAPQRGDIYVGHLLRVPGGQRAGHRALGVKCRSSTASALINVQPEIESAIKASTASCLTTTSLPWGQRRQGKVRDTYDLGEKLVIVTTDRQSAFDRLLASIPFKGQVLNQTSAWWFQNTEHIVSNGLISVPDPNISIMEKVDVFPVEFVVRGYMTGSTDTSLWTHYKAGDRVYCGITFEDGMQKNQRLAENIITPTTKSETHDELTSPEQILTKGIMSEEDWMTASKAALELFSFGQEQAQERGLLLVDTKYEFGKNSKGEVVLVDEIHTPDSSRYWIADTYKERHAAGQEPENIDKEFLRLWFRENCDPYKDEVLPGAPQDLIEELSRRYIFLFEKITGQEFALPSLHADINSRMHSNLQSVLD